jgi:hypothetical protein
MTVVSYEALISPRDETTVATLLNPVPRPAFASWRGVPSKIYLPSDVRHPAAQLTTVGTIRQNTLLRAALLPPCSSRSRGLLSPEFPVRLDACLRYGSP